MTRLPSLSECATQLRDAPNPFARAALRNRLARAARSCFLQTLQAFRVPDASAEDYAGDLTFDLVCRIERGDVAIGHEDAYVKQCARNRARDHFREQSGVVSKFDLDRDVDVLPSDVDPERLLLALEAEEETRQLGQEVRALLDEAPPRYRDQLVAVYLNGTAIEELVQREILRRSLAGEAYDVAASHRRARAAVDKVLERARTWVRERASSGSRW